MVLRWPGSKLRSADYLVSQLGYFDEYREPFLGSGAVFWRLPKWDIKRVWLNDLNSDVIRLFRAIKGEIDADFVRRATHYMTTYRSAKQVRDIWPVMAERVVLYDDAAAYWFLNRYAVGAIVSRARRDVAALPADDANIERYYPKRCTPEFWRDRREQLRNVELTTLDYRDVLTAGSRNRVSVLLDPPYTIDCNNSRFYERDFTEQQWREVRDNIRACPHHVVLTTGDDALSDLLFRDQPDFEFHEHYYTRSVVGTMNPRGNGIRRKQFVAIRPR